jgi:TPR repeat protein
VAMNNLAYFYERGLGVGRDMSQAAKLYCEAAQSKMPEAQQNWEAIRASIQGQPQDCDEAARRAASDVASGQTKESTTAASKTAAHPRNMSTALICIKR